MTSRETGMEAKRLRAMARTSLDPVIRAALIDLAREYERMSEEAETRH